MKVPFRAVLVASVLAVLTLLQSSTLAPLPAAATGASPFASSTSFATPDAGGDTGHDMSMALDAAGNPVVAYVDVTNQQIKLLHCGNPDCAAGNTINTIATGDEVASPSLALDGLGKPVIAYAIDRPAAAPAIEVAHCGDTACAAGNQISSFPADAPSVSHPALQLDSNQYPVVAYVTGTHVTLLHCNDANCTGGGEITQTIMTFIPAPIALTGSDPDLAIDSSGRPVITFYRQITLTSHAAALVRCGDANCSNVAGHSALFPAGDSVSGQAALSVELDPLTQNPRILFSSASGLALQSCGSPTCDAGNTTVTLSGASSHHDMALTTTGLPAVAFAGDGSPVDLAVLRCGHTTNCGTGASHQAIVDEFGDAGAHNSLALDADGNPVIAYYDATNTALKIAHCSNVLCADDHVTLTAAAPTIGSSVGFHNSLKLDAGGNPVVAFFDETADDLKLLHCSDPFCLDGTGVATPDTTGNVGRYASLQMDSNGNPVVAYSRGDGGANNDIKLLHCGNPTCTSGNTIDFPDTIVVAGGAVALALDSIGNPVIAMANGNQLGLLHCDDPNCAGGNQIFATQAPDSNLTTGTSSLSLALDATGRPVIAYHDIFLGDLKVVHCDDPGCSGSNENPIQVDDGAGNDVGQYPSLALDASGNPAIAYYDLIGQDLKFVKCGNSTCSTGNTIRTLDGDIGTAAYTSLVLDASGNPVISYQDNGNLAVVSCGDPSCAPPNVIGHPSAAANAEGLWTSLALDPLGYPIVAHLDDTLDDLRVTHCANLTCSIETLPNPTLPDTCRYDVVLVIDESGSMSAADFQKVKDAMIAYVNSVLVGSNDYAFSIVAFGNQARLVSGFQTNKQVILATIDAIVQQGGATNWDDAVYDARNLFPNRPDYGDLMVFFSDGQPNWSGGHPPNTTAGLDPTALDRAVEEANAAKTNDIRLFGVGVGNAFGDSFDRLIGPNTGSPINSLTDYITLPTFDSLSSFGQDLAVAFCFPAVDIGLTPLTNPSSYHIGITYQQTSDKLVVSTYYSTGIPYNLTRYNSDGSRVQFSAAQNMPDEIHLASPRDSLGGFTPGDIFAGNGMAGQIARVSADGVTLQNPWVTLPGEIATVRGNLHFDTTGLFGGDLIAVTTDGSVWRVTSAGVASNVANLPGSPHLAGVTTTPNDVDTYGPLAGKILATGETQNRLWIITAGGTATYYTFPFAPNDIDLVPPDQNYFLVSVSDGKLYGAPAEDFVPMQGELLLTEENAGLWRIKWNGSVLLPQLVSDELDHYEQGTFAPAGLTAIPCVDNDADAVCSGADNCPRWPNVTQTLPPWPATANDPDCDGFSDVAESTLGTDPTSQCPAVLGVSDAWPVDFTMNRVVNITDVLALKPVFNLPAASNPRFDLAPGGTNINITDVLKMKDFFTLTCTP